MWIYGLQTSNVPRIVPKVSDVPVFNSSYIMMASPLSLLSACALPGQMTRLHSVRAGLWGRAWRRSPEGVAMFCTPWSEGGEMRPPGDDSAKRTLAWTYSAEGDQHENWDAHQRSDRQGGAQNVLPNVASRCGMNSSQKGSQQQALWRQEVVSLAVKQRLSHFLWRVRFQLLFPVFSGINHAHLMAPKPVWKHC